MDAVTWVDLAAPFVLFAMMAVVGLELTAGDFRRVARYPLVVVVGTAAQWTLLPLVAAGLLATTRPEPGVAAGIVLVTAAPGGGVSNVFTFLAGANTALSVTLTAVSSLLAVVALPLVTATGFAWFVGEEGGVAVPVLPLIGQLVVLVVLPIGLGMELRRRRPHVAERHASRLRGAVLVLLAVLFTAALRADQSGLVSEVFRNLGLALLWSVAAAALGLAVALLLRLPGPDRFTFAIEFSVKNVGLAAIVALAGFDRPEFRRLRRLVRDGRLPAGGGVFAGVPAARALGPRRRLARQVGERRGGAGRRAQEAGLLDAGLGLVGEHVGEEVVQLAPDRCAALPAGARRSTACVPAGSCPRPPSPPWAGRRPRRRWR